MIERLPNYDAWLTTTPEDRLSPVQLDNTVMVSAFVTAEMLVDPNDDVTPTELAIDRLHEFLQDPAVRYLANQYDIEFEVKG